MPHAAEAAPEQSSADEPAKLRIIVQKQSRLLSVWVGGRMELCVGVALGRNPADKRVEGDLATPLGDFYVCAKNPCSRFVASLCLSYPNLGHAARGLAAGLIDSAEHAAILDALSNGKMPPQHTRLGGEIYIQGRAAPARRDAQRDWTRGCIALEDSVMRELFDRAALGTRVRIVD